MSVNNELSAKVLLCSFTGFCRANQHGICTAACLCNCQRKTSYLKGATMILRKRDKEHAEAIIKHCTDNGMSFESTMGLWNHLVRLFKRIELLENQHSQSAMVRLLRGIRECHTLLELDNWQHRHFSEIDKILDQ